MRILIIQQAGEHPENTQYRECLCMARALRRRGVSVDVRGEGFGGEVLHHVDAFDAVLLLENYDTGWVPDLAEVKVPKVFWSIDAHCAYDAHMRQAFRHKVDLVLCAVYGVKFGPIRTEWFPNAYPHDLFSQIPRTGIEHEFGFCGSRGPTARRHALDTLSQRCGLVQHIGVLGDAMVSKLKSYQISFNYNIGNDINYRTFESMACGCALLTNHTPGIDALFKDGVHLYAYSDEKSCVEAYEYCTQHAEEVAAVAEAGKREVESKHTYDVRAEQFVGHVLNLWAARERS